MGLGAEGLKLAVVRADAAAAAQPHPGAPRARRSRPPRYRARHLGGAARHGLSIDALETTCESASMSGEPLFPAQAELAVPAGVELAAVRGDLEALANELMVDLGFEEVSGSAG